ncbi:MAG TPA: acetate--CoA ligase family protein, partial [Myxococcota bacterium]|nr:acetate--CoA ligase family protein [Myxococcota bacterium]
RDVVLGQRCFANLNDIPGPVEVAFLVGPPEEVEARFEDCVAKGVGAAWVLGQAGAGFGAGDGEAALRRRLADRARASGIALAGPGSHGFLNVHRGVYAFGLPIPALDAGPVGLVFQSGELLLMLLRAMASRAIGVCSAVSSGDEAALDATEYLRTMLSLDDVKVVGGLLERVRNPRAFVEVCDHAARLGKPLVILKLGRGRASRADESPTSAEVTTALLRQKGVIEVHTLDELLECCNYLAYHEAPGGDRVAAVAISAGACGTLAEVGERLGVHFAEPDDMGRAALQAAFPDATPPLNPLDLAGDYEGRTERFVRATTVLAESSYDAVVYAAGTPRSPDPPFDGVVERLRFFRDLAQRSSKPMLPLQLVSEGLTPYGQQLAAREGIRFLQGTALGLGALSAAIRWGAFRRDVMGWDEASEPHVIFPFDARRRGLDLLEGLPDGPLDEAVSRQLLAMYGVPLVPAAAATSPDEAAAAADRLGYPVAVKALCTGVNNRSAVGAVALELQGEVGVRVAFDQVVSAAERAGAHQVRGAIVSKMVRGIVPVRCGAFDDPLWGPTVMVGVGGGASELEADRALRVCPTGRRELRAMLSETRASRLLEGFGGRPPADRNALVDLLERLALLMQDLHDRVAAIDLNPVAVFTAGGGCYALDALVTKFTAR